MGPLMIDMAFMPLYMWEMWDVTPVTDTRTDSRKVGQYSVWTESAKENSQFPSQPLNDWVMSKRGSLFLRITSHSIKGTITFAVTRVNMRNIYTSSQTQSQRHLSLQHLQTQRPNKVGLLCGAAQIIRKKVDKWFCTQWLALWQTPHFWQGHRLRQQCNWKSTLFYFLTPTFFMAILRCFVSGLLSINFG